MCRNTRTLVTLITAVLIFNGSYTIACTNLLVTKGASVDGSVMITYTCDGTFHPELEYSPAAHYEKGDSLAITNWQGEVRGWIEQVEHTYAVVGMMNEHQLAISETTTSGRKELRNPDGLMHYWDLMELALQRAHTAREAIKVMTDLVERYGYLSNGESFSIADQDEAWIMEMFGPGEGGQGAVWVALRIPDGYISAYANKGRIGEFPLDDPENCLYSKNAISLAVEKGYYDPDSGEPFLFSEAYCPTTPSNLRFCSARVWSIFRRAAPSQDFSADYHRGVVDAEPYPLWIKPDTKLSIADVFALMRDHYEGTDFDATQGIDAGPYGTPNRWRPLTWHDPDNADTTMEYGWERSISTQQTGFSFVSQSRSWLPDPIGGVYWYGVDDTYMTCYVPLYCGINAVPESFARGSLSAFSWESAWWVFNLVANYANLKYSYMAPEILAVQAELEGACFKLQPVIEKAALELCETDHELMTRYLTGYSVGQGEQTMARWKQLAEHLITKYNDGYVQNEEHRPKDKGYPDSWLRRVLKERPDQFKLPVWDDATEEHKLVD
ncbi:MAG: C69 family dipeptidase [candidate division Zixibacteria bacterium]|nr:C69 family dipeptidase [candidate division Zixibacteria bacterium]